MALFRSKGARKDATRGTAPIEVRKGDAGLFTSAGGATARAGVLPGHTSPLVQGQGAWTYAVNPFHVVTVYSAGDGALMFGNDGSVSIGTSGVGSTVPAAPGAGLQRYDIIWVRHPTSAENGDVTSAPIFGVASGTAGSSAVAPSIPTGAFELARNLMTSAATSCASAGNNITQTAPYTALRGTPVVVRNSTEQAALTALGSSSNPVESTRADTGLTYRDIGAGPVATDGHIRTREVAVTASGVLSAASDIAAAQTVPAAPFGPVGFTVRVNASVGVSLPAGLGGQLDLLIDGVIAATCKVTNAGGTSCSTTLAVDRSVYVGDSVSHAVRVVVTPLAGTITVLADTTRCFEIQATRQVAL